LYLLGVLALLLLLSIDLLTVLARFLVDQGATLPAVARLLAFRMPWFLHLTLPVAVVFSVLVASGRLSRDAELKAAYAGGVPPARLLLPLVGFGVAVAALAFAINGWIEPWGEAAYEQEIQAFIYSRPPAATQLDAAFAIGETGTFFASRIRASRDIDGRADLSGVLIQLDDGRTITAPRGVWDAAARTWALDGARVTDADTGRQGPVLSSLSVPFPLASTPTQTLARPTQQTFTQLLQLARSVAAAGGDASEAWFGLHRRAADATAAVVFAWVAGALGLRVRDRGSALGITIALMVGFWASWTLTGTMFEQGVLTPALAAWSTPAAAAVLGVVLTAWAVRR
jgi:lipopolysaccharide export system permease protein